MAKLFDGARMTSATTGSAGTGTTMTLGSAVSGYLTFAGAGVADGDVVSYGISDGANWETGRGTYTAAGTTLSRTTVAKSTNSNNFIALSGAQQVYITALAEDLVTTSSSTPFFGLTAHNLQVNASVASNALTVSLKTNAGVDATALTPIQIPFRDTTLANGGPLWRSVTAALSVVVPSGQTLGSANTVPFRFWLVAIDNGGTVELGLINCSTATALFPLVEYVLQTTTAIAAAASAGVIYSTTARTSKAICILAYLEYASGLTTAGTYASAPTLIQLFGPGVPRPGTSIQTVYNSTATRTIQTAASYATALSQAISLSSPANLVNVQAFGGTSATAGLSGLVTLFRSSTIINSQPCINLNTGNFALPGGLGGIDKPGTTSSTTYSVQIKGDGTNAVVWPQTADTSAWGTITIQEIMG